MKNIPIALQLYSVRNQCAEDFFGTIEKVAKMGYKGVEFAGYHGKDAASIKKVLDDNGLKAYGTHTMFDAISDENIAATVELHKTLDCKFVIVPWIPEEKRSSVEACKATGEMLTDAVDKLAAYDLRLGFHAHSGDMRPLENGKSAWYLLAAGTPDSFIMQYDTANGLDGGADPVQPILDWPGRGASTHLKGWKLGVGPALVGEGDINWPAVLDACESVGGTEVYVIEHEDESVMPALEAVDQCLKNLHALGR